MHKKLTAIAISLVIASSSLSIGVAEAQLSTSAALSKYNQYYSAYNKDELVKVNQYRTKYAAIKGSLADQIVERAIWYMDNGYMVYGHGRKAYAKTGIVDCSNYVSLVYSDFNYTIPTAVKEYGTIGTKVSGVYAKKVGNSWSLQGTENLRPGDIMTWYKLDAQGRKVIGHAAIFMGMINGQPAVIGTSSAGNPTAIGIVNNFKYWWGSNFFVARRVLPAGAWTPGQTIAGHQAKSPVIPVSPVLAPQRPVTMPEKVAPVVNPTTPSPTTPAPSTPSPSVPAPSVPTQPQPIPTAQYVTPRSGWVSYRSGPSSSSTVLGRLQLGEYARIIRKYNSYWYEVDVQGKNVYITTNTTYIRTVTK